MPSCYTVLLTPTNSSYLSSLLSPQQLAPPTPLAATLMDFPASIANKRLMAPLSPLPATLTRKRGWTCLSREHRTSPRGRETRHSQGRSLHAHPLFPIPNPLSMLLYILTSLLLSFSHERQS